MLSEENYYVGALILARHFEILEESGERSMVKLEISYVICKHWGVFFYVSALKNVSFEKS